MKAASKSEINNILINNNMENIIRDENALSIYHKNNWDHLVIHWGEECENQTPSYIDFFFDAACMVKFFRKLLNDLQFDCAYISAIFPGLYKLKTNNDDVSKDVYDEYRRLLKKVGLKTNTSQSVLMNKQETVNWCDRFSVAGFMGLSEFYLIIPKCKLIIKAHHHMNYLVYTTNKSEFIKDHITNSMGEILCNF